MTLNPPRFTRAGQAPRKEERPHGDEPRDLVAGEGQAKRNPAFV